MLLPRAGEEYGYSPYEPAYPAPDGYTSNLDDPYSVQPTVVAVVGVTMAISLGCIFARMYVRHVLMRQFDHLDVCMLMSGACFCVFAGLLLHVDEYGQSTHIWNVSETQLPKFSQYANIIECMYTPSMFFPKYVVLRQIEGIFVNHARRSLMYKIIWGMIWANLLFYLGMLFSFIFACVPRAAIMYPAQYPDAHCIDTSLAIIATSAINVVSDFAIFIIPIVGIWRLQMPLKRKIGAGAVFAVGIFALVTCVVRLYFSVLLALTHDATMAISPVGNWALAEFTTVIAVACVPSFPRLWKDVCGSNRRAKQSAYEFHSSGYSSRDNRSGNHSRAMRSKTGTVAGGSSHHGITVTQSYDVRGDSSSTTNLRDSDDGLAPLGNSVMMDNMKPQIATAI